MCDVLFKYKERKESIDISQAVGVCCRKGSIMLKIKEGGSLDVCIDGLAYLLIAKSEAILSYYSKDKKTKKVQKKKLFPLLPKIKKGRGQTNADINFARVDLPVRTASRLQSFNKDRKPIKCGCTKGKCSNGHCKCKKNNFSCNSKCACNSGCKNRDT